MLVPGSAGRQRPGGALVVEAHARPYTLELPDGTKRNLRAVTVMVVNRRKAIRRRFSRRHLRVPGSSLKCAAQSGLFPQ